MATTRGQMIELIIKVSEMKSFTAFLRENNRQLMAEMEAISAPQPQLGHIGGKGGVSDPVARAAEEREKWEEVIRINERAIRSRMNLHSRLSLAMAETLTEAERSVIWAKHADHLPWWKIERTMKRSASSCKRMEKAAMEKLCAAWDEREKERMKDGQG